MYNERVCCVLCKGELKEFFSRKEYPITCAPPDRQQVADTDIFADQNFSICKVCSCLQLTNLIDPYVLYGNAHNDTFSTPTWLDHHKTFCDFIFSNSLLTSILEVGGSGKLFKLMNHPEINYTCLDITEPSSIIDGITYITDNCESYNYSGHVNIVMSHVFEHLYNPHLFLEAITKGEITNVFISIPNMKALIDVNTVNVINNEHTFFIDKVSATWLFSQYGYTLVNYLEYKSHSLCMHFYKTDTPIYKTVPLPRPELETSLYNLFLNETSRLSDIIIKPNSFISPAGINGQFIIYSCKPSHIVGFLDNDKTKQDRRIYGSSYPVFSFDELIHHTTATIYIWNCQYTSEIIKQIQTYPTKTEIIII